MALHPRRQRDGELLMRKVRGWSLRKATTPKATTPANCRPSQLPHLRISLHSTYRWTWALTLQHPARTVSPFPLASP
jgi:hypothetical protein